MLSPKKQALKKELDVVTIRKKEDMDAQRGERKRWSIPMLLNTVVTVHEIGWVFEQCVWGSNPLNQSPWGFRSLLWLDCSYCLN